MGRRFEEQDSSCAPSRTECRYFYGNYFRGRIRKVPLNWQSMAPGDWNANCADPVPGILRANACESLVLHGEVKRTMGVLKKRVIVTASCMKSNTIVTEPHVGCGQCHPIPPVFEKPEP
jgi:hypothetical protein